MQISLPLPFPESYWVIPGLFMAGEYPGRRDELLARQRMQALLRVGIVHFYDLTHPEDWVPCYTAILHDEANGYLKKVEYRRFPIEDRFVPAESDMNAILDGIDECIRRKEAVYVHCIAGIGRTGTVVGCYLVRHGHKPQEALERLALLRSQVPSHWARSPEADEQVDYIFHWKRNHSPN